ncbi:uncharacterized protein LOC135500287 [Lineus longissimus]|uniref:uncharacterized protein LOC135500287 n=1 Tax=Lineus longissimus TaxID=88925 RepID=UPI002B4EF375
MCDVDDIMTKCGTNAEACKKICDDGCGAFDKYDKDKNGSLSKEEIGTLLAAGGSNMSKETVFSFCDLDADNKVTKEEFIKALVCTSIEDDIRRVFNDFDKNKNHTIDKAELGAVSGECAKQGIDQASLARVMEKYDTDSSGEISFDEFKAAFFSK